MIEQLIEKDMKGSGQAWFKLLSQHLPGGSEESHGISQ
jgi:hypothetical protein